MTDTATFTLIRPLADRVLVRPDEHDEMRPSGLVVPGLAQEAPQTGVVLAVGPGRYAVVDHYPERVPVGVEVGDTVVYGRHGGTSLDVDGETLLLLPASELLATVGAPEPAGF